jgi:hypothetical protein
MGRKKKLNDQKLSQTKEKEKKKKKNLMATKSRSKRAKKQHGSNQVILTLNCEGQLGGHQVSKQWGDNLMAIRSFCSPMLKRPNGHEVSKRKK